MWFGLLKKNTNFYTIILNDLNFIFFKKNIFYYIYITNKKYFIKFFLKNYFLIKYNNLVLKLLLIENNSVIRLYLTTFLKVYILTFFIYKFKKVKFDGKGYYLYKNKRNVLGLQFNYSHKVNIFALNIFIKNFSKRSWIFFGINRNKLSYLYNYLRMFRKINVFTLRGIRFSNQIIFNKKRKS